MAELASRTRLATLGAGQRVQLPGPARLRARALAEGTAPPWAEPARKLMAPILDGAEGVAAPLAWTQLVRLALARARSSRDVVEALLAYSAWLGRRGAIFLAVRGQLRGWAGRGRGITRDTLSRARLSLSGASILGYLAATPASYRGRIHHDVRSRDFLIDALSSVPDDITAFSITTGDRVIGVAYADEVSVTVRGEELARLGRDAGVALARARFRERRRHKQLQSVQDHDQTISH